MNGNRALLRKICSVNIPGGTPCRVPCKVAKMSIGCHVQGNDSILKEAIFFVSRHI